MLHFKSLQVALRSVESERGSVGDETLGELIGSAEWMIWKMERVKEGVL